MRPVTGRQNKQIRKQGLIPAVLYGHKIKNLILSVDLHEFEKVYQEAGESTLIKLEIDDSQEKKSAKSKKERIVLIYKVARHPVSGQPVHADFYQVKMDEPITTEVPLVFVGESAAVKELDGVLVKNIQSLEIKALPVDLPHQIEVDISALKTFDDNVYIKNLKLPAGVTTESQSDEVVVSVIPPRTRAELEKLEEAPEEKVEEVEVAEKGKAEEPETEEGGAEPSPEKESSQEENPKGGNE